MATISQRSGPALIFRCYLNKPACGMQVSRFGRYLAAIGSVVKQSLDFRIHSDTTAPIDLSFVTSFISGKSGNKYRLESLDDLRYL